MDTAPVAHFETPAPAEENTARLTHSPPWRKPAAWGGFFLLFWALMLSGAPPGYYWGDSAEVAATSWLLSNSHPTSYPLFGLLMKLPGYFPGLSLAFAQNISHQFLMWLALWLLAAGGALWAGQRAALFWVATLGAGGAWLVQAMGLEVYSLWMPMLGLVFFWAMRWVRWNKPTALLVAMFCFGLMGWLFPLCLLLMPLVMGVWLWRIREVRMFFTGGAAVALVLLALTLPSLPYVFTVLRSAALPPFTWGMATTPLELFQHLTLSEYGVGLPQAAKELPERFGLPDVVRQFGPFWVVALGLLMLGVWRARAKSLWLLLALLPIPLFTLVIHHGDPAALRLPALLVLCGAAAWGAAPWLGRLSGAGFAAVVLVWGGLLASSATDVLIPHDNTPQRLAMATLRGLPRRAVLIMAGEPRLSVVQVLQTLHGVRPDVLVVPESHLGVIWTYRRLKKQAPELRWPAFPGTGKLGLLAPANIRFQTYLVLENIYKRPFFFTYHFHHLVPPLLMHPQGAVIWARSTGDAPAPPDWQAAPLPTVLGRTPSSLSKKITAHVHRQAGLAYLGQGRPDLAMEPFEQANALWPDELEQPLNLGTVHNQLAMALPMEATSLQLKTLQHQNDQGDFSEPLLQNMKKLEQQMTAMGKQREDHFNRAQVYYNEAQGLGARGPVYYNLALLLIDRAKTRVLLNPDKPKAAMNLLDDAAGLLNRALGDVQSRNPATLQALGSVYLLQNLPQDAEDAWLQALEMNPGYLGARRSLVSLYISQNRMREAVEALQTLEALSPNLLPAQLFAAEQYLYLGLKERAMRCYQRLTTIAPFHPQVQALGEALKGGSVQ